MVPCVFKIIHLAARPVEMLSEAIHKRLPHRQLMLGLSIKRKWYRRIMCKRVLNVTIGITVMFWAGKLYHSPPAMLDREFWELSAFGIHGIGLAPVLKVIADLTGLEV